MGLCVFFWHAMKVQAMFFPPSSCLSLPPTHSPKPLFSLLSVYGLHVKMCISIWKESIAKGKTGSQDLYYRETVDRLSQSGPQRFHIYLLFYFFIRFIPCPSGSQKKVMMVVGLVHLQVKLPTLGRCKSDKG